MARALVKKAETSTILLEAAKKVLRQNGYSGLSTRDVAAAAGVPLSQIHYHFGSKQGLVLALFEYLNAQLIDRQNALMEELVGHLCQNQRQRNQELQQWQQANPGLVRNCRRAAETLGRVQTQFLRSLTREVNDNAEALADGEFVLSEFVDRFGPRMAHLNGVLQVLAQISGNPAANNS